MAFIDRTASETTGNRMKEGGDMQHRDPRQGL